MPGKKSSFERADAFVMLSVLLILCLVISNIALGGKVHGATRLNDLQAAACDIAQSKGTCDTRLPEIGIVLKDECCSVLGKCCE